jgi:transposase
MARTASGAQHLDAAYALLREAKSVDELRTAQAVLLPLMLGLSIEETALAIGRSKGATCSMRTRFSKIGSGLQPAPRSKRQLRNRATTDLAREAEILDEVLAHAQSGGVIVIPQLKPAIEAKLNKTIALSSVYRMLARHGWRKLAPDTQHPQGDGQAREDWKKNSPTRWAKS